ncbi:tellurium resistance protein TerW [Pantoea sp. SOD02]|uniref:tellurium resistance protein TerW n=1 Tax=Pantoea sp. SOD02 TaxID=2970818 RepID=UPI002157BDC3|nr:tellurium resistance protein TerW [Pantoea sp. SOD02]UVC30406.1 tellurium resistance protein TerW [Pantoea sp. SOD02]
MQLSTRQTRVFMLASLLSSGKPVASSRILASLDCSEPTLTRALKELRESWSAEIKYSRLTHCYQLTEPGKLDKKSLRHINEALKLNAELQQSETVSRVFLDKEKKKAVSLSLRMSVLRKIDQVVRLSETTRSDAVEMLVESGLDELIEKLRLEKKKA